MLNEERVILMTRLASYEKREGKKNMAISKYFRGDYLTLNILKAIISSTIAFFIGFVLYLLYNIERLFEDLYNIDFLLFGKNCISIYVVFVISYSCLTYIVFALRYKNARQSMRRYQQNLKKLSSMYRQ